MLVTSTVGLAGVLWSYDPRQFVVLFASVISALRDWVVAMTLVRGSCQVAKALVRVLVFAPI